MTYQRIRVSLSLFERFIDSLRGFLLTAFVFLGVYGVTTNFEAVRQGAGELFHKLLQLQSIEVPNVKAAFKVDVTQTQIYNALPDDLKDLLPGDVLALKSEWVGRLLYVGDQGNVCRYEHPEKSMQADLAYDQHLLADDLIKITPRPVEPALQVMRTKLAAGDVWTIGKPLSCYTATLTDRGRNVKTALIQFLSAGFAVASTSNAEARRAQQMKVAGVASN